MNSKAGRQVPPLEFFLEHWRSQCGYDIFREEGELPKMDMKTFLTNQIRAAMEYKWCKGIELRRDPGPEAVSEWITKNAERYRKDYNVCVDTLVEATLDAVEKRIKDETCPICNKDRLRVINRVVIEEFTKVWFMDMARPDHDKHVEEI